jgi:hypothetical protein
LDNFYQIKTKIAIIQCDAHCSKLGAPTLELNTGNVKNALFGSALYLSIYKEKRKKERKEATNEKEGDKTNKKKGREMAKWEEASIRCMHPAKREENPSMGMHGSSLSASCVLISAAVRQLSPLPPSNTPMQCKCPTHRLAVSVLDRYSSEYHFQRMQHRTRTGLDRPVSQSPTAAWPFCYEPYFFPVNQQYFFSYSKSTNSIFSYDFSAKRCQLS